MWRAFLLCDWIGCFQGVLWSLCARHSVPHSAWTNASERSRGAGRCMAGDELQHCADALTAATPPSLIALDLLALIEFPIPQFLSPFLPYSFDHIYCWSDGETAYYQIKVFLVILQWRATWQCKKTRTRLLVNWITACQGNVCRPILYCIDAILAEAKSPISS